MVCYQRIQSGRGLANGHTYQYTAAGANAWAPTAAATPTADCDSNINADSNIDADSNADRDTNTDINADS